MLRLFLKKRFWNEQWKVSVFYPRFFDFFVKIRLYFLPDCIAPRLYDHKSPYNGMVCQLSFNDYLIVPLAEVLVFFYLNSELLFFLGHFLFLLLRIFKILD